MHTPRNLFDRIKKSLKTSPVVLLAGARQTGKTTLVQEISKQGNYTYVTFDDLRFNRNKRKTANRVPRL